VGPTLGAYLRNMGPQSTRATVLACARAAEAAGLESLWVADHVAIPPDQAEGSGGRYLDPLATLAFVAGATERIGLGTGVLVVPYRPPLTTAKWVATIQELSAGRLRLGVGVGWMEPEFRAIGVAHRDRVAATDATLAFLHRCFASDDVEANGQRFLFRPRPARPPILVGGAAPHALRRAARLGDGWMPMASDPEGLRADVARLRELMAAAGKPPPDVTVLTGLPLADPEAAAARARAFAEIGATRLVYGARYEDADAFRRAVDVLATRVAPALVG
jgi:probable F420-dependent oxidoreductase